MGNLPKTRVEIAQRAFQACGVDFAGPISIKTGTRRNAPISKAYICVFVYFFSKAVHIELVSDLSTNTFLTALRRFWARRGISKTIYSDNNTTNFVGADRKLKELRDLFLSNQHKQELKECLSEVGVKWNFIPSRFPYFGGLWEAAVKSIKGHLRRTLGNALLTLEELMTVLIRVEACINSRPITPLSSDPSDLNALTPAHFLIGGSLTCLPDTENLDITAKYLSRWQRTQQLFRQIWNRWSREYLSQLQGRTKWQTSTGDSLKMGMLVLLKDENLPPLQWSMGRVVEILPGKDGVNRVAVVQTKHNQLRRAARMSYPLPIETDVNSQK